MDSSCSLTEGETLVDILLNNCERYADKTALQWLNGECNVTESYTYAEIKERTREIAAGLQELLEDKQKSGLRERAVLCYPPGLEFILVFIACLRAGIIPAPVSPPNPIQSKYTAETLMRIIHDCGASFVLTSKEFYHDATMLELISTSPVPWHCEVTTELMEHASSIDTDQFCDVKPEDIAFLQYTSGSTGHPKGVMVSHENLVHNSHLLKSCTHTDSSMIEVSFLPHFHDMGLIASYLHTLYVGGKGYYMAPATFVQNPAAWIEALSKFKGTHGKVPNFALDLILKRGMPKCVNLRSVRYICNGSDMVLPESIQRFEEAFAQFGLKKNTIRPSYGMAEHVVCLCTVRDDKDPTVIDGRISCGKPLPEVSVKVIDPETCLQLPEGEIGEIWVDSPSKTLGYWEKEEETQRVFEAELDDTSDRTYLRTGDLGLLKNSELVLVGRMKDMIVVRGRNIHPVDIEEKLESSFKALRPGRTVALQYNSTTRERGSTTVAYIAELRTPSSLSQKELVSLSSNIATMISLNFQIDVSLVVFVNVHTVPHTTSGKRQRSRCKQLLLTGTLDEIYRWTRSTKEPPHTPAPDTSTTSKPPSTKITHTSNTPPHVEIRISGEAAVECSATTPMEVDDEKESTMIRLSPEKKSSLLMPGVKDNLLVSPTSMERRRSAPPLPKDPRMDYLRRKSTSEKRSAIRRTASDQAHSRRNSLQTLTDTIGSVLGVNVQPESNLWAHGCNSLKALELSKKLQSEFGFALEPHLLFTHQTPMALMAKLQRSLLSMGSPPDVLRESSSSSKEEGGSKKEGGDGGQENEDEFIAPMRDRAFSAESKVAYKFPLLRKKRSSDSLLDKLHSGRDANIQVQQVPKHKDDDIAILGMSCSFPGCRNTSEFWDLLMSKTIATTSHTDPVSGETYSGGFTSATATFDHTWFGISEWEASTMDPQQYMLLHSAWECLHNAQYVPDSTERLRGRDWGVFVGIGSDSASYNNSNQSGRVCPLATNIATSVAANRIARFFDFRGPIQSIDTACASSLSALDAAQMYLKAKRCSAALVCGVNTLLDPHRFPILRKMGMLSPDEKNRTFDKSANGYVRGEGCGSVLLMPLAQAKKEGRRILAVLKATATNNNGASSATMTAPSVEDQTKLFTTALSTASLEPQAIDYIEAHGTGSKVGDLIEADAIYSVIANKTRSKRFSVPVVGGCKANIGHLETASGIASLIKTVLVLEHAQAPGNANLVEVNSSFANKQDVCVSPEFKYLTGETQLVTALVNSFGFGGTNAAAILQQYSTLPHMAKVKCQLLFSTASSKSSPRSDYSYLSELMASVYFFTAKLPVLKESLTACEDALHKESEHLRVNVKVGEFHHNTVIFKLCYALLALLQSLDVEFTTVGATDPTGEILALLAAGALTITDAAQLLLSKSNDSSLSQVEKSFQMPRIPIQSCTGKLYYPTEWHTESSRRKYIQQLKSTGSKQCQRKNTNTAPSSLLESTMQQQQGQMQCPTLSIVMDKPPSMVTDKHTPLQSLREDSHGRNGGGGRGVFISISEFVEQVSSRSTSEPNCMDKMHYLREKLLLLRNMSDAMVLDACTNKPLKTVDKTMPMFHQRYPLRALVDSHTPSPTESGGRVPQRKQSTLSTTSSINAGDESGYITQANSAESLNALVLSNNAPDIHTLTSMTLSLSLSERSLSSSSLKDTLSVGSDHTSKQATSEEKKSQVISSIVEEFRETLSPTSNNLEVLTNTGLFQLGLNSLKLMQLSDLLESKFNVEMTISELIEHETVGEIANAVVAETHTFQASSGANCTLKAITESCEPNDYPILTKEGYYTIPPMDEIRATEPAQDGSMIFYEFAIGKGGVKIVFQGDTDVSGLNLGTMVHIEGQQVIVCHDPTQPKSSNLNKPSLIYFDMGGGATAEGVDTMTMCQKFVRTNATLQATTWKYHCSTGMFVMEIDHFY